MVVWWDGLIPLLRNKGNQSLKVLLSKQKNFSSHSAIHSCLGTYGLWLIGIVHITFSNSILQEINFKELIIFVFLNFHCPGARE